MGTYIASVFCVCTGNNHNDGGYFINDDHAQYSDGCHYNGDAHYSDGGRYNFDYYHYIDDAQHNDGADSHSS